MVAFLYTIRTEALGRLEQLYPGDPRTAASLQAILLGQTVGVDRRWTNDFRLTGTYHALVISGQHVTVLALSLLFLLRLLHLGRIPSLVVAAAASWFYAFLSGMSSPVVRAAGGFTLFMIASYCFRRIRILNSLAIVAFIYLFFSPDLLVDPSFQLSFLSAAAIAVFAMPLMQRWSAPLRAAVRRFRQPRYDLNIDSPIASQWRVELRLLAETIRLWTKLASDAGVVAGGVGNATVGIRLRGGAGFGMRPVWLSVADDHLLPPLVADGTNRQCAGCSAAFGCDSSRIRGDPDRMALVGLADQAAA